MIQITEDVSAVDIVLDTNVLLQCRPLEQLTWSKHFPDYDLIRLHVGRTLFSEIDKLKSGGNSRRAQKARSASQQIRKLLQLDGRRHRLSNKPVPIDLCLSNVNVQPANFPDLDFEIPDNRLIAEALMLRSEGNDVVVVSHDTGPLFTAQLSGLRFLEVPEEWLLPAEKDDRDKKIDQLEKEIIFLRSQAPNIAVRFRDSNDQEVDTLDIEIMVVPQLSEQDVLRAIDLVQDASPQWKQNSFNNQALYGLGAFMAPPTSESIEKYENEYAAFLRRTQSFLRDLPLLIREASKVTSITLCISNDGIVPADELITHVTLGGNFRWRNSRLFAHGEISLPTPPERPSGLSFGQDIVSLHRSILPLSTRMPDRDPTKLYWFSEQDDTETDIVDLRCDALRQRHPQSLLLRLAPGENQQAGALTTMITAKNLPEPAEVRLPIRVEEKPMTLLEAVRRLDGDERLTRLVSALCQ